MADKSPKANMDHLNLTHTTTGDERRDNYLNEIEYKQPIFPLPLEYSDIDTAMFDFANEMIDMDVEGEDFPTFTLYSNQRFSEYSQTWKHVDNEGNLLQNFKTVNRDNNPAQGKNQGGYFNIPGNRRYTLLMREVTDDGGNESYEIYSMKQPFAVDLTYSISIVTNTFKNLNIFNEKVQELFKAKQCYIRPNNHYIPLTLTSISDNSTYSMDQLRFFIQTAQIEANAYIIKKEDFEVVRKPKRVLLHMQGDKHKAKINLEEAYEERGNEEYKTMNVSVELQPYKNKCEFKIDEDFKIEKIKLTNARSVRVNVNGTPFFVEKGFEVKNGDTISIKVLPLRMEQPSTVYLMGYNPSETIPLDNCHEDASKDVQEHEEISVE